MLRPSNPLSFVLIVDVDGKLRDFHALEAQWTEDDGVQLVIDNTVRQAKGVLILCACDDSQALESATYMAERVLRVHDDDKFPVVLVATKSDLPIEQQKLSLQEAHEFATKHNVIFLESSAATSRAGVLEAVAALIRTIDATPPPAPLTYKPKKGGACAIS